PCRCPACRARPRLRVTGLLLQMVQVCRPPESAVVLTVACKCGGAILEVRVRDVLAVTRQS
ncbi:MAG TPA: hypothetical protein PK594_09540, partial [Mycobacterium sp.]|nr:hypothetical protein [Mycobacterium sp.]